MSSAKTKITSVADLLARIKERFDGKFPIWYRGQSVKSWKLVPSLARNEETLKAEHTLIKRFMQNALPFTKSPPQSEWDWMFLLQHYGVPTRLLDWTEGPLVALYFACEEVNHHDDDGAVWCLNPIKLNEIANVEILHPYEVPFLGMEPVTKLYLPSAIAQEKISKLSPLAVTGTRDSNRMHAQLGNFTVMHHKVNPIEGLGDKTHCWMWVIPKRSKKTILDELKYLAISRLTLFPELTSVAQLAKGVII